MDILTRRTKIMHRPDGVDVLLYKLEFCGVAYWKGAILVDELKNRANHIRNASMEATAKDDSGDGGKWIVYINANDAPAKIIEAVGQKVVYEAKCSLPNKYGGCSCCFYVNQDDIDGHRRFLEFAKAEGILQKLNSGRYKNIAYKNGDVKPFNLDKFINLYTGEWCYN